MGGNCQHSLVDVNQEMTPVPDVIKQGAEAVELLIYECDFMGRRTIAKERFRKAYRHPVLDEKLTARRVIQEARDVLHGSANSPSQLESIAQSIGSGLAQIHDLNLIHGDLTTSNMILRQDTRKLVWIDFGLSYTSTLTEDKGFESIINHYKKKSKNAKQVLVKFEEEQVETALNIFIAWLTMIFDAVTTLLADELFGMNNQCGCEDGSAQHSDKR
ncbi:TP53-regulating kinase [Batrachochytrium salamandrivorans]|nr:TP53-regulating kinase [Batrachochytrium salamandrivorans]